MINNQRMKRPELLCPQCKEKTPLIEAIYMSEMKTPMLRLKCSCFSLKKDSSVDLDDYLAFLTQHKANTKACFKHNEQKAQIFCKDCSLYMCGICFSYHKSFNPLHQIQSTDSNRKTESLCFTHLNRSLDYVCEECSSNICFECIRLEHSNHSVLQLQEYWDKTERKVVKWKERASSHFISKQLEGFSEVVKAITDMLSTLIFNLQQVKLKLEQGSRKICETNLIIASFVKVVLEDFYGTKGNPQYEIIQNVEKIHPEELLTANEDNTFKSLLNRVNEDIQSLSSLGKGFLSKAIFKLKSEKKRAPLYLNANSLEMPAVSLQSMREKDNGKISLSFTHNLIINNRLNQHNKLNDFSSLQSNQSNCKLFNKEDIMKSLNLLPTEASNFTPESLLNRKRLSSHCKTNELSDEKYNQRLSRPIVKIPTKKVNKPKLFSITVNEEKRKRKELKMIQQKSSQLEMANRQFLFSSSDDFLRTQTQPTEQLRLNYPQLHSYPNENEALPNAIKNEDNKKIQNQLKEASLGKDCDMLLEIGDYGLMNKFETCVATIMEHSDSIKAVIQLSDCQLASGGSEGVIRFFNPNEGYSCKKSINIGNESSECLIELNNKDIAVGLTTGTITIYSIQNTKCSQILIGHTLRVTSMAQAQSDATSLLSSSEDCTLKVWNIPLMTCLMTLSEHQDGVNDVLCWKDSMFISASGDATIKVWNSLQSFSVITLKGHCGSVNKLLQLPQNNSNLIVSASNDTTLKVWDFLNQKCIGTLLGHSEAITSMGYLKEGFILSASNDLTLKLWNSLSFTCIKTLTLHQRLTSLVPLSNGLIATVVDNIIKLWL